jgi:parallel beta-helix repeat protein
VGQKLTASTGTWSGATPMTFTYSWARCDKAGGSCVSIAGATTNSYMVASGDGGSALRVTVTATNPYGSATANSPATAAVPYTLGSALPPRMPESSGGAVLYVSVTGSDSNAGTITSPVKTVKRALSLATAGTIIYLRGGSYGTTQVSGYRFSPSNPVTIESFPRERAIFTGQTSYTNAVYFSNCQGIRLRNLTFDAPYDTNLKLDTDQHIELDHLVIRNAGRSGTAGVGLLVGSNSGFSLTYSDDIQVWNSIFYNNGHVTGGGGDHQIYFGTSGNLKGSTVESGVRSGVIANSLIYDGPAGYGLQLGDSARNVIVTNNTFVHAFDAAPAGSAIVVWNGTTTTWGTRDCVIVNNIFTSNTEYGVVTSDSQNAPSNIVKNNLAFSNGAGNYHAAYGTKIGFTLGTNLPDADPLFVDPANKDFHLTSGSPAIGKADAAYAPPADASGANRPVYPNAGTGISEPALGAYG